MRFKKRGTRLVVLLSAIAISVVIGLCAHAGQGAEEKSQPNIKVTILGSGTPGIDASNPRMQSGIVVDVGETRWLIDAGAGVLAQMYHLGFPPGSVNKMFITHLHIDHCFDLDSILFCRNSGRRAPPRPSGEKERGPARNPLDLYGPDGIQDLISDLYKVAYKVDGRGVSLLDDPALNIEKISAHREILGDGWKVNTIPVAHAWMDCWAFRLDTDGGKSVVVTGDVGGPTNGRVEDNEQLLDFSKDTDLMVVDGLHVSPQVLAEMVKRINPKKVLVTHLANAAPSFNRLYGIDSIVEEIKKASSAEVIMAVDGTSVEA